MDVFEFRDRLIEDYERFSRAREANVHLRRPTQTRACSRITA